MCYRKVLAIGKLDATYGDRKKYLGRFCKVIEDDRHFFGTPIGHIGPCVVFTDGSEIVFFSVKLSKKEYKKCDVK